MTADDKYSNIAEYYDYMLNKDLDREEFFKKILRKYKVKSILDCACGTGNDLLLFHSLGYRVTGSDISESMLKVSQQKIAENGANISLKKADFHNLNEVFQQRFDAVLCLSNAVNEVDVDIMKALKSMMSVLNKDGVIIFDQGQTDCTMKNPPTYFPEVNDKDLSRLYTMNYTNGLMVVNVFDFIHKEHEGLYDFRHSEFKIRIRLQNDWVDIVREAGLEAEFYGNWNCSLYDKEDSKRLIIVARKA